MTKSIEVEIRILLKNRREIEEKIKNLGAKIIYFAHLKDYWFCPKNVKRYKNAMIDKIGFALRIRETVDLYSNKKSSSLECKTLYDGHDHTMCHEHEMNLDNVRQMRDILKDIGLKEFLVVDKERTIYKYQGTKFCFDTIKGLGEGLEIELMAKKNIRTARQKLINLALSLGIKQKEILEKSLTFLIVQKQARF